MDRKEFLYQLSLHNDREWFDDHRDDYKQIIGEWYADLDRTIAHMAQWEPRLAGLSGRQAAYRIFRDTRFSPDKTPYKTWLSASFAPYGKKTDSAGYYIHYDPTTPGESMIAGGIWAPEAPTLKKLRKAMIDNIEEFEEIIHHPEFVKLYPQWEGRRLKTAPKGWPKDHPDIELLRLITIGRWHTLPESFFKDPKWPQRAAEMMHVLQPLVDFINYSLFEE